MPIDDTSSSPESFPRPVTLRAPVGARQMEIDWDDGHSSIYPHRLLRGFCPCAECQGHQGPIRFRDGGALELSVVEEVGHYAVRLEWSDGHGTGIYSFRFLRRLCPCDACSTGAEPESRSFGR
jgi:DUF971 family protein